jgi:hypothetical protein
MRAQEVLSIFTAFTAADLQNKGSVIKTYPELDAYFDKGMYVEKVTQTCLDGGNCLITFVFRYYNLTQSKTD